MKFTIKYHKKVVNNDIPKLATGVRMKIRQALEDKLQTRPQIFGRPLRKSLKGYRKLRVSKYRIVFKIQSNTVIILAIIHREDVYLKAVMRIK